jgi:hypothetical protein
MHRFLQTLNTYCLLSFRTISAFALRKVSSTEDLKSNVFLSPVHNVLWYNSFGYPVIVVWV